MPSFTQFLELTLPAREEFVNSWDVPNNANFEEIDDWLDDLYKGMVGTGSTAAWAALKGSTASLSARLAVSLNADGTLNVSGSTDIMNMATSAVDGVLASPAARLDNSDFIRFNARQPFAGGRFVPVPAAGPSAGAPPEDLDSGIAFRTADFGASANSPLASPRIPWAPGLMSGGASPLITGLGIGKVRISADAPPAVFDIDGYLFRIREIIDLDWTLLAPTNGHYVWIFVDRNEGTYNSANFKYTAPGGGAAAVKDLRKLQSGTGTGTTSNSIFTATGTLFSTAAFGKVKEGDTLVIPAGAAAGSYVIAALDGITPDTKFTIRGKFKANLAGVDWYIHDKAHPNLGAVVTGADPTVLPAFVAGRVYFARCQHNTGGNPTNIVTFLKGGVYDSGWFDVDAAADFPKTLTHNLGAFPTDVQVWCRTAATSTQQYQPLVKRSVVTDAAGPTSASFLLPSMQVRSSELDIILRLLNASATPSAPAAIFTSSADVDQIVCQLRVIARK